MVTLQWFQESAAAARTSPCINRRRGVARAIFEQRYMMMLAN
jgi:hypothetical protein